MAAEQREDFLSYPIGLLEVGVAGEDEGIHAQLRQLVEAGGHLLLTLDVGEGRAAPGEVEVRPHVGVVSQISLAGEGSRHPPGKKGPTQGNRLGRGTGGPAFGLVGSYEQVAERLDELLALGVDAFILAGNPRLEEAYRVGEEVLPLLGRHRLTPPDSPGALSVLQHTSTITERIPS